MMKKFVSMLLILAMGLTMGMTTLAADLDQGGIAQTMTGYFYDDEGNCVEIIGHLVETDSINLFHANQAISATYEFNLRATTFGSRPEHDSDSQNVSTVYSTISYYVNNGSYLLSSVSGSWTISDPDASITSAIVSYGCISLSNSSQTGSRSVSNNFYVGTGFSTYVSGNGLSVGANLTLSYLMNSRTWTFTLRIFVA